MEKAEGFGKPYPNLSKAHLCLGGYPHDGGGRILVIMPTEAYPDIYDAVTCTRTGPYQISEISETYTGPDPSIEQHDGLHDVGLPNFGRILTHPGGITYDDRDSPQ